MPRRSGDSRAQNLPKSKKIKKDHEGKISKEDAPFRSPNSVSELWQKMHFHLLKETFGYLDLRNTTKFRRVSTLWRDTLNTVVSTNKGVVFLDWRIGSVAQEQMDSALIASKSWMTVFKVDFTGIEHFVSIGEATVFEKSKEYKKLFKFPHSLTKVTFWEDAFAGRGVFKMADILLGKFGRVELRHCKIELVDSSIFFDHNYYSPAWGDIEDMNGVTWDPRIEVPLLVFDETFEIVGAEEPDEDYEIKKQWLHEQLDEQNSIWPYGEDQLEWLKKSLDGLKGQTLKAVKYAHLQFLQWRPCYDYEILKSLLKPTGIKSGASYNGRELDTLDCAYLGRLLVYLNEHKRIPRFKPPPHAFPDDFEAC